MYFIKKNSLTNLKIDVIINLVADYKQRKTLTNKC